MTTIKAQEFIDKNLQNLTGKEVKEIRLSPLYFSPEHPEEMKLTEDLIIQDYPNLEEISLPNHELTSLTITNCPNLKEINVRNNQLTKLEISSENKIEKIIASKNELTTLDLTNCANLKELIIPDNPYLTEIKGLNLSTITNLNVTNTSVNLSQDYEELKASKEDLLEITKTLRETAEEKELVLTEAIQNSIQVEEAIQKLLKKTEKDWKYYLNNPQQALPSFQLPETRRRNQKFLLSVIQAKVSGNYQKLLEEWKIEDNAEEVFAGILIQLSKLLGAKSYLKNKEAQPLLFQNPV